MDGLDWVVYDIEITISSMKCSEIADLKSKDKKLRKLQKYILEGWPDCRSKYVAGTSEYHGFKDEISVYQGMVLKVRVLIPEELRPHMLVILHKGHQGITKMGQ